MICPMIEGPLLKFDEMCWGFFLATLFLKTIQWISVKLYKKYEADLCILFFVQ